MINSTKGILAKTIKTMKTPQILTGVILLLLLVYSCQKESTFILLEKHTDSISTTAYYVYTDTKDSVQLVQYSEKLRKANADGGTVFIYFCEDSTKLPVFIKGKIAYVENSFACYSNFFLGCEEPKCYGSLFYNY